MSTQFGKATDELLSLAHFSNGSAGSTDEKHTHEMIAITILEKHGFTSVTTDQYPLLTRTIMKNWIDTGDESRVLAALTGLPPGSIIHQPSGSQDFPDILVFDFNSRLIPFECKSSTKNYHPTWNDKQAKPLGFYFFSTKNTFKNQYPDGRSTIFLGKDVISQLEHTITLEWAAEIKAVNDKFKTLMADADLFNRGWKNGSRPKFDQGGGAIKSSYFAHPSSEQCVSNAITYAYA